MSDSVGKMGPKVEECQPGAVQGRGNPQCDICLPRDGRSPGGALGGRGRDGIFGFVRPEMERIMQETITKTYRDAIFAMPSFTISIEEGRMSAPAIQFKGSGWYVTDYARKGGVAEKVEKELSTPEPTSSDKAKPKKTTPKKTSSDKS